MQNAKMLRFVALLLLTGDPPHPLQVPFLSCCSWASSVKL